MLTRLPSRTLFVSGATVLAARSVLQLLVDRAGRSNDLTDFGLGVLFGIGAGLMMLVAWRMRGGPSAGTR
jgi:hypothetical protein